MTRNEIDHIDRLIRSGLNEEYYGSLEGNTTKRYMDVCLKVIEGDSSFSVELLGQALVLKNCIENDCPEYQI